MGYKNRSSVPNPMIFKGSITLSSDFPTLADVENGWTYTIVVDVTDNDATKTNTGQSFLALSEIAWNGSAWTELGYGAVKSVNAKTGVVTLTQDDIGDGTIYKQYSQTEKTKLSGIETAADVTDAGNVASSIHGVSAKGSFHDNDAIAIVNSEASNALGKNLWSVVKSTLKTYFDSIYTTLAAVKLDVDIADAITKKHTQNSDTDLDATFEATFVKKVDTVNVLSDITSAGADIEDAVTKRHAQNSDTKLDDGQANEVTAAQLKKEVVAEGGIDVIIGDGTNVISTGLALAVEVPYNMTLTTARLFSIDDAVTAGAIVVDIWAEDYANYPPTDADTITGGEEPTLAAATKYEDTALTSWTKTLSKGDILFFNVDSAATVTKVLVSLKGTRT